MCILCYTLTGEEHWTDARPGSEHRASLSARRGRLLTAILSVHGLDYRDDPSGVTALVSDRKGNVKVVHGLGEVWATAEQLAKRRLDPLDPTLISRLVDDGSSR
jgi:hypothetical protein